MTKQIDPYQIMVWVRTWLDGEPIKLDGVVYIFPHGTAAIRRLIRSLGITGLDDLTGYGSQTPPPAP